MERKRSRGSRADKRVTIVDGNIVDCDMDAFIKARQQELFNN